MEFVDINTARRRAAGFLGHDVIGSKLKAPGGGGSWWLVRTGILRCGVGDLSTTANVCMPTMGVTYSQFFPPPATLTEENLSSQNAKVFVVTGGASGVGLELCAILYQAGGKVYLAGRSEANAQAAISKITARPATTPGELNFLLLSLDDLTTIKPAVEALIAKESRLDVLFKNAGISLPPPGSVSAQGHELQMATNCLGHYLFAQLLLPTLLHTAKSASSAAVRVIWTSSIAVDGTAPNGGMNISELTEIPSNQQRNYLNSKTGNWFLASALADQVGSDGILSVTQNPGNLKTGLLRHAPWSVKLLGYALTPILYSAKMGAYTELWAGLSQDLKIEDGGKYVVPWGRLHPNPRPDLVAALKSQENGGTGIAALFTDIFPPPALTRFKNHHEYSAILFTSDNSKLSNQKIISFIYVDQSNYLSVRLNGTLPNYVSR